MGRKIENPRYQVVSLRVSDAECEVIAAAKAKGMTPEALRQTVLNFANSIVNGSDLVQA